MRASSWLLTAPLLLTGLVTAHSLGYRWAISDPQARAHVLEDSGHSYFAYLPAVLAVALTLAAAALAALVWSAARRRHAPSSTPWPVALLPPIAFLAQELLERALHTGHVHPSALLEPAVLIGLALQLPIALIVLGLARLLAEGAEAVGRALVGSPPALLAGVVLGASLEELLTPALSASSRGWTERGPPSPSS
jgi:hypothetical protein